jgi:hypothetical protein
VQQQAAALLSFSVVDLQQHAKFWPASLYRELYREVPDMGDGRERGLELLQTDLKDIYIKYNGESMICKPHPIK